MVWVAEGSASEMLALELSQTNAVDALVALVPPVLQTRTPTGDCLGPSVGLLLSSRTTFQLIGVMVRVAAPWAGPAVISQAPAPATPARAQRSAGGGRPNIPHSS